MRLHGQHTVLRPITLADAPRFVRWLRDPMVRKFTTRKKISLLEEEKWIRGLKKNKDQITLAIDTAEGLHIGSVGLQLNPEDRHVIFDILIGDRRYWHRGYGADAAKTLIDFGFRTLKLHRISLGVCHTEVIMSYPEGS